MPKSKITLDQDLIRQLAKLLEETGLSEIEIEQDDNRRRRRSPPPHPPRHPPPPIRRGIRAR